jgi:hypothetical protein
MTPQPPPNGNGQNPQYPPPGPGPAWPAPPPDYAPLRHRSPSERMAQGGSPLEPLERILDKGIVIDAWAEVRVLGIPLASLEARVVVASIETYLYYAESIMQLPPIARGPMAGPRAMGRVAGEAFSQEGLNPLLRAAGNTVQGLGDTVNAAAGQATQAVTDTARGVAATALPQEQDWQQQQRDRETELERRELALSRREEAFTRRESEPEGDDAEEGEGDPERPRSERGRFTTGGGRARTSGTPGRGR